MITASARRSWVLLFLLLLSGCTVPGPEDHALDGPPDPVPPFSLTERSGRVVSHDQLQGKVWIASFVFTRCTGPCPQISGTMAKLQQEVADRKDVILVTFTVDPDRDDPEELKRYAAHFSADPERWLFLTGKQDDIYQLLVKGFKVAVAQNEGAARKPGEEVSHSTRLVLVDRRCRIRGYFDGRQVDEQGHPVNDLPRLHKALEQVLREKP